MIDDEPAIVDAMRALLGSWGCDVAGAGSDVEADARFTSEEFDAVIADLHLQGERDGLGLIEQYRKRLPAPGNALLLTATATDEVKARAQAAGVAVLRKPAGPDDIRRFLEGLKATGRTHAAE